MTPLIDADFLIYRACYGAETTIKWDEGEVTKDADLDKAKAAFLDAVEEACDPFAMASPIIFFSDRENNFRKKLLPTYKANRKDRPVLYHALRDWAEERRWMVMMHPGLEADDLLGITQTSQRNTCIVSVDKDMLTIPGWNFNPQKDLEPKHISEREADHNFYTQVLTGDTVDNYKGCPGIGPKRAAKILDGWTKEDVWTRIVTCYGEKGLTEEDALVQARMARILRSSDYNPTAKEPILWTPSSPK